MLKNIVKFALVLTGIAGLAMADVPLPKCLPCGKAKVSSLRTTSPVHHNAR